MQSHTEDNSNAARTIDLQYLNELSDGNFDFVEEMINLFLNSVPQSVTELEGAIENGDWVKVKAVAHRIKPSFGFIGAKGIQEILNQMERNAAEVPDVTVLRKMLQEVNAGLKRSVDELQQELARHKAQ